MAIINHGRVWWTRSRDEEGFRTYTVRFKIETNDEDDGPQRAGSAPGLPIVGQPWNIGNDNDFWCYCTPFQKIEPMVRGQPHRFWYVDHKFTNKPLERCGTTNIDNPLAEPDRISGSFVKGSKDVTKDKDGNTIQTTSFEPVPVQFDENTATVRIEQNRINLELDLATQLMNKLNDATLWGLGARKVKFSNFSWERKYWGLCTAYYTRTLEFDINFNTFDRDDIPNRGRKLIRGEWEIIGGGPVYVLDDGTDKTDPLDYIEGKDPRGNLAEQYIDDADGGPSTTGPTFLDNVQHHEETNLLVLGIPGSL